MRIAGGSAPRSSWFVLGLLSATAALSAGFVTGCGSQDRMFAPEDFIDEINANGADLTLGPVLTTTNDGFDVHVIEYGTGAPSGASNPELESGDDVAATMIVLDDSGQAENEFARCEKAPLLTCFRAANVVLRFEDMNASDRARIVGSLEAIATGDS